MKLKPEIAFNREHEKFDWVMELMCLLSPTPTLAKELRKDLKLSAEQFGVVAKQAEDVYGIDSHHIPSKIGRNCKRAYYISRSKWLRLIQVMDAYMEAVYG